MYGVIALLFVLILPPAAFSQAVQKVRMAYTSINVQTTPIYMMKDLELPRKHGLDAEILIVPVSSRAVQAVLAGAIAQYAQEIRAHERYL